MGEAWTWERVEEQYVPVRTSTRVCLRNDLILQITQLEDELTAAEAVDLRENRSPVAPGIARRILTLRDEARAHEVEVIFEGIPREQVVGLEAQHQPSEKEKAVGMPWGQGYPAALMAASCVAPAPLTAERARWLADKLPLGEFTRLWQTCLAANTGVNDVPKGRRAEALLYGAGEHVDSSS